MSNAPFNEDGEPYMTAAQWLYEQSLDSESQFEWDDLDDYAYYDDEDYDE